MNCPEHPEHEMRLTMLQEQAGYHDEHVYKCPRGCSVKVFRQRPHAPKSTCLCPDCQQAERGRLAIPERYPSWLGWQSCGKHGDLRYRREYGCPVCKAENDYEAIHKSLRYWEGKALKLEGKLAEVRKAAQP